jgi:hypothetical protein
MGQGLLGVVGRRLQSHHLYLQLWRRPLLPCFMLLLTIPDFSRRWQETRFTSKEAEAKIKPLEILLIWNFQKLAPVYVKTEEPPEADEWIRVMEQKFGLIRCTETQKPLFATQQLRGPASTWWANFVAIQPEGHPITWAEFKQAFREHYILDGILQMKLEEFVRLKQGGDSVMQYLAKFNHLSQYIKNEMVLNTINHFSINQFLETRDRN